MVFWQIPILFDQMGYSAQLKPVKSAKILNVIKGYALELYKKNTILIYFTSSSEPEFQPLG